MTVSDLSLNESWLFEVRDDELFNGGSLLTGGNLIAGLTIPPFLLDEPRVVGILISGDSFDPDCLVVETSSSSSVPSSSASAASKSRLSCLTSSCLEGLVSGGMPRTDV